MNILKPKQLGHFVGEPQFEEGKTTVSSEGREILKELSRMLNHGYDDYYVGLLDSYAYVGLIDYLSAQVRAKLMNETIDAQEAWTAYEVIKKLKPTIQ
ncbi:hypothetical protein [Planomicrobium okeanokoites]|uniref:hypothetical protein n=1 Tax=Planomicrobium okeanokoites TaxID=244 RepID=UPI000A044A68|nr:hypothetical protein [Planomicrobium okeanokoites]